jgi:hypothetical protein
MMNKKRQEKRFSSIKKMKGLKLTYEDRMSLQSRRQQLKEAEDQRKADKVMALEVSIRSHDPLIHFSKLCLSICRKSGNGVKKIRSAGRRTAESHK